MHTNTVLVTGCAGFIGSNFVRQFRVRYPHARVIGIDDFSTGLRADLDRSIIFYEGRVDDHKLVNAIFKRHRPQFVFHFAALPRVAYSVEHPTETTAANVVGTVTLLEACRDYRVKRFIFSSTAAVYGTPAHVPTREDDATLPLSPYGLQKLVAESFCKHFSDLYDVDTVCLRYFNVFGPGQRGTSAYSTVVAAWLEALYFPKKKRAFLEGDGKASRDFVYVDDVVRANILAMSAKRKLNGAIFNIGSGTKIEVRKVLKLIEKYTKRKLKLTKRPPRAGDVRQTRADISKARRGLGFRPQTDFKTGLKQTIAWFEKRKR